MVELKISRVDKFDDFVALHPDWTALVAANDYPNAFLTHEWLRSWWEAFGEDHRLYILVARKGEQMVGIAPLMLTGEEGKGVVRFIGSPDTDYADLLSLDPELTTPAMFDYLLDRKSEWSSIDLEQISERSSTVEHIRSYFKSKSVTYRFRSGDKCHTLIFDPDNQAREEFSPKRNKTLKWSINFFKKHGNLELREFTSSEEIEPWLDTLFHYHMARWRHTFTPSKFLDFRSRRMYHALARNLGPEQLVSLMVLLQDDLPLAYQFNFRYDNTAYVYTLAHNGHFLRQSPGKILNNLASEHYIHNGLDEVDFTRGGESYKSSLTNQSFSNYHLTVYGDTVRFVAIRSYTRFKNSSLAALINKSKWLNRVKFRLSKAYANRGLFEMVREAFFRGARMLFNPRKIWIMEPTEAPGQTGSDILDVCYRVADVSDITRIGSYYGTPENSKRFAEFKERLEAGEDCFLAESNGHVLAAIWGYRKRCAIPFSLEFEPGDNEVMLADIFASPTDDMDGLLSGLLTFAVKHYESQGVKCLAACSKISYLRRDFLESLGFRVIGSRFYLKIMGIRLV